jgi:ABC-2 type transport system ATP-binding protein
MIAINGLRKSFPERTTLAAKVKRRFAARRHPILNDISLTVNEGEIVGLLGGNGAGKTTLLQILATLSRGDAGTVTIGGVSVDAHPERVRQMIGYCGSADRGFYYRMTVRDNLRFFGSVANAQRPRELDGRIDEVLTVVDLQDHDDQLYAHLSTGMRQRLSVARALLGDPPVLLFDEPTRAVDPIHAQSLRSLIRSTLVERLGKTVVLATNVLEEAWTTCHRVAVLRAGAVVAFDAPSKLESRRALIARYRIVVDRIDDAFIARLRELPGFVGLTLSDDPGVNGFDIEIRRVSLSLSALLQAVSSDGVDVLSIERQNAAPADIFADLVSSD